MPVKSTIAPLLCLLAILPLGASEADEKYQRELFNITDLNKDGRVSEREFVVTVLYDTFASFADEKGRASKAVYFEWIKQHPEVDAKKEYAMMDSENKGYLVFADVLKNTIAIKEMEKEFKKLDRKNKGYITLKDLPDLDKPYSKPDSKPGKP